MKTSHPWLQLQCGWLVATLMAMIAAPVAAETSNFGTIKLSPGFTSDQGTVSGYTGGSYSLSAISNRDRNRKLCIGFADPSPDHILVLEKDFDNLQILVNSQDSDTTLLIQGPDNTIRCGDDTGRSKDASVSDRNFKQGTYRIWVGIFETGVKTNYTLTVQQ